MFSSVCALPSKVSAEDRSSLFDWFTGSTAQSDFSSTCVSAVRFMALGPASILRPKRTGDLPVLVHVVSQRAQVLRLRRTETTTRDLAWLPCCLPPQERSRHPVPSAFRSSIARPTDTSVYASSGISRSRLQDSRPGWIRYSPFP